MKVIYCAGEQGRVTLDIVNSTDSTDGIIFGDDNQTLHGKSVKGHPIIGSIDDLPDPNEQDIECVVAFGNNQGTRLEIADTLKKANYEFFNAIHNSVSISESVKMETGVTINAQSYIGPDVIIDEHALIESCVNISHGSHISKGATITPGAILSGGVSICKDAYISPNATINEDKTVGEKAIVGAGAVVTEDVPPETTVVGVPASPIDN